ncbi:ATP-grasp domain-containing protein [Gracilimonas sp. Q87]|uniref:ATP-grasp domain-containing protein n=1 Tax=Gracilimonas sp. Q87 TaxID=3384766 RepID=UPI0039841AE1
MNREKQSVLLFGGEENLGLPVIRCLGYFSGIPIHYAAIKKTTTRFSRYLSSFQLISGTTEQERLESLIKIINNTGSQVLIPIDERSVRLVIKNRDKITDSINIPHLADLKTFHQMVMKNALNEWLESNDIPYAKIWPIPTDVEADIPDSLTFPVLFKPVWDRGGDIDALFINIFRCREEMINYFGENEISSDDYFLQEYIPGYDIDCSLYCKEGEILAHTIQKGFILQPLQYSPAIELLHNIEFLDQIEQIINKLKWSGICHLDFRYDEREKNYKLIDFNARFWTTLLGSLVAGVNFPYLAYQSALGETFPVPEYDDTHFVLTRSAIKEMFKFNKEHSYSFRQTGLYYALQDPLPEIFKVSSLNNS